MRPDTGELGLLVSLVLIELGTDGTLLTSAKSRTAKAVHGKLACKHFPIQ